MADARRTVVFSGGGTGGHLYPALALADALEAQRPDVVAHFIGARRGIEARVLPARGLPHDLVQVEGLPRSGGLWMRLRALLRLARAVPQVRRRLRELAAELVVVTGGYAGLPAGLAARSLGLPLALQEQNAVPGLTTRLLAAHAAQIHLAYPEAADRLRPDARARVQLNGNPITPPDARDRRAARARLGLDPDRPVLLVVGGSQGSAALNAAVLGWLERHEGQPRLSVAAASNSASAEPHAPSQHEALRVQLLWSTGPAHVEALRERLAREFPDAPDVHLYGFIDAMSDALAASDLALSRAGAMATSEFLAWGIASILVPLPTAAADHQTSNAQALAEAGAARHVPESQLDGARIEAELAHLLGAPETLATMQAAARERGRPDASTRIATALAQLLGDALRQPATRSRSTAGAAAPATAPDAEDVQLVALGAEHPIHLMGIGGAGMNPLAEWLLEQGAQVSGCDHQESEAVARLRRLGASIEIGHEAAHVDDAAALVITAAIAPDHPELARARSRGIPVLKRAAALGAIVNPGRVIAVAGTHGKTSTSALTMHLLIEAGLDPTGFIGGHVSAWEGNLRSGSSDLFVVEADEYDRSFHHLRPEVAVITNLEADHLDIYGDLAGVQQSFRTFADRLVPGGALIICADDPGVCQVFAAHPATETYGCSAGSQLRAVDVEPTAAGQRFRVMERGVDQGWAELPRFGLHALRNALAAAAVARRFGVEWSVIRAAWATHRGVERRYDVYGTFAGVTVIDDYAHHPAEIRATLEATRTGHPERRMVAVFQPHLYSRTRDFAAEFGAALALADEVWVTGLYPAREAPIEGVSEELIVDAARACGAEVRHYPALETLADALAEQLQRGDVVLCMGAGSIGVLAGQLRDRLQAHEAAESQGVA